MSEPTPETAPAPETPAPTTRSGKKIAAGGAGVAVLAAVVGGGAYAYNTLSGGGAQPEDVLPATTQVYARLDLDPGASQKIELFKLLNKVPEVGDSLGIKDPDQSDVRRLVFKQITADACPDIDYDKDVEPWLGDRVGVGANLDDEQFVIAVQVKDEGKAKTGIAEIFDCAGEDYGIAFHDGYALVSDTQKSVDDALDGAKKATLGDSDAFSSDMDALGEKGIASAWVDAEGLIGSLGEMPGFADALTDEQRAQIEEAGSAAMALRVDGSAIELAGVSNESKALDVDAAPIGDLPTDTVAALSISGFGEQIGDQWDAFLDELNSMADDFDQATPEIDEDLLEDMDPETRQLYLDAMSDSSNPFGSPQDFIEGFESETGLSLPDDLEALLGQTFTLSIGGANLEKFPTFSGPGDLEQLDVAIRTTDGDAKAIDVMRKLADYASKNGVPLVAEEADGGAVLATSSSSAKNLADGGDLGGQDAFKAVMPYGDDTTQALYVDVAAIVEKLLAADPPADIRDDIEQAKVVQSVGLSAANSDGRSRFSFRVSFTD